MAFNLRPFNPFGEIASFDPMRNFDSMFKDFNMSPAWSNFEAEPRIKLDVSEADGSYIVKAEIPGVKKEDIKVSIEGNQVSISAKTSKEKEEKKGETVIRSERYYGQQYRSFTLANNVDDAKAQARYQDGILELTLPKLAGSSVKNLTIN